MTADGGLLLAIGCSKIGGGQRVFLSFVQELHRRGRAPVVVLPQGPLVDLVRPYASAVHVVELGSMSAVVSVARILRREPARVLNPHLTKCSLIFAIANVFFRRRLFCTLFNAVTHEALSRMQRRVYPLLYGVLHRLSDGVIVNSEQNKRHVVDVAGMDPARVKVIYSGIDVDAFAAHRRPRASGGPFVIGAVGRLAPEKGHVFLVRALAGLRQLDYVCHLVGDGPMRGELERVAREEGVSDRVRFLGFQSQVAEAMSAMDVVVMPSLDETFGVTIVEAFALRKMVIATDVGGIPELVRSGETGLLVPSRDPMALARAIEYAATHQDDCDRMAQRGFELAVASFTTAAMADGLLGHLYSMPHAPHRKLHE